ncbi:hypothetical protein SAMN02745216_05106 [Desulfatibacillum alkenivorans DSM 16219]|jgi:hypothetical protein|uniref:Uncharacterized protein n=1 Tax=Desulfatibacillum alkenivorans DSM 16219 TaxID=1121393 RepID=A0A1M7A6Q7_9BACT|nr:hypothetical protein SAMN02745216_05106 [Desulfatibacillum alkenivorans DSM 16219]
MKCFVDALSFLTAEGAEIRELNSKEPALYKIHHYPNTILG